MKSATDAEAWLVFDVPINPKSVGWLCAGQLSSSTANSETIILRFWLPAQRHCRVEKRKLASPLSCN